MTGTAPGGGRAGDRPRIVMLVTSPRLPAGVLAAQAWDLVRRYPVFTAAPGPQADALAAAGANVTVGGMDADDLIDAVGARGTLVWLAGADGDPALTRRLGLRLARTPGVADLEVVYGSWDPPGARLLDVVAVMDRLLAPEGGDPWKRAQTHQTLARFLLEEAYEAYDAIEAADTDALREELGDVLLQVVLHARLAENLPDGARWNVDDVAGILVDKLIRRNPHVFAGTEVGDLDQITANWEQIKQEEKARTSVVDGVALAQPALALAAKVLHRVRRAGLDVPPPGWPAAGAAVPGSEVDGEPVLGAALFAMVVDAVDAGLDPEAALRRTVLEFIEAVRAAEAAG